MSTKKGAKSTTVQAHVTTEDEKQEILLKEAKQMVTQLGFSMKRALDANNLMEALKFASNLISELRTGHLTPKTYYALYIHTVDQLHYLQMYISEGAHGRSLHELYELIQYAGNILPRLYLLVTVGSVFIKKLEAPAKDLLVDMVELCRGVQHPTRGLFLRTYLLEMTKDKLPDEASRYEGVVSDSIDFILINFTEMNKLWVRMQHGIQNLSKREQEREELNILVGKNLALLSRLDALTIDLYQNNVLPRILEQVIQCKDRIAQHHLMLVLIQAFSDEFHLRTLSQLLETCPKLVEDVDVHAIISSLMDRLSSYCVSHPGTLPKENMFKLFKEYIEELVKTRKNYPLEHILSLADALIVLALKCYKEDLTFVDSVFQFACTHVQEQGLPSDPKKGTEKIVSLLHTPMEYYKAVRPILQFSNYNKLLSQLSFLERRKVALFLADTVIQNETIIPNAAEVFTFLEFLTPLVQRHEELSEEDWLDDQTKVAYVINMFYNKDVETMYEILIKAKLFFLEVGKTGIRYTLLPLLFKALRLVQTLYEQKEQDGDWEKKAKGVCKYANDIVTAIRSSPVNSTNSGGTNSYNNNSAVSVSLNMTAFNLYLQCALQTGRCGLSDFAYGFLTKGALSLYEDETMTQSQYEYSAIRQLIAVVQSLDCFDTENYEKLAKKMAQHSSKLTIVEHQSRATVMSAHLFVPSQQSPEKFSDSKSAIACLKKAMSVGQAVPEPDLKALLLVELLDHYIYFFEKHSEVVEAMYVNAIIQKIKKHFQESTSDTQHTPSVLHFRNIKEYVETKKTWENLVHRERASNKDVEKEGIEVESTAGLSEGEAKKQAQRWKEIEF